MRSLLRVLVALAIPLTLANAQASQATRPFSGRVWMDMEVAYADQPGQTQALVSVDIHQDKMLMQMDLQNLVMRVLMDTTNKEGYLLVDTFRYAIKMPEHLMKEQFRKTQNDQGRKAIRNLKMLNDSIVQGWKCTKYQYTIEDTVFGDRVFVTSYLTKEIDLGIIDQRIEMEKAQLPGFPVLSFITAKQDLRVLNVKMLLRFEPRTYQARDFQVPESYIVGTPEEFQAWIQGQAKD